MAGYGGAGQGMARHGSVGHGRLGAAGLGRARRGAARLGRAGNILKRRVSGSAFSVTKCNQVQLRYLFI
jgi:hypothetical protein